MKGPRHWKAALRTCRVKMQSQNAHTAVQLKHLISYMYGNCLANHMHSLGYCRAGSEATNRVALSLAYVCI